MGVSSPYKIFTIFVLNNEIAKNKADTYFLCVYKSFIQTLTRNLKFYTYIWKLNFMYVQTNKKVTKLVWSRKIYAQKFTLQSPILIFGPFIHTYPHPEGNSQRGSFFVHTLLLFCCSADKSRHVTQRWITRAITWWNFISVFYSLHEPYVQLYRWQRTCTIYYSTWFYFSLFGEIQVNVC